MRTLLFAAIGSAMLLQVACKQGDKSVKTEHGHTFINHTNLQGNKIQYGEVATVNLSIYLGDSLVNSTTRDAGGPRELMIPDKDKFPEKVPAVLDALLLMTKGDSATALQDVDSLMAKGIPPGFGQVKQVKYVIKVVDVLNKEAIEQKQKEEQQKAAVSMARLPEVKTMMDGWLADYKGKKFGSKLTKSATGLEYIILDKGAGAPVKTGETVPTHYYGCLQNGKPFDNSFERGGPAPFTVGQMIPGFDEGLLQLNRGGKAVLFIPYQLGYGDQGTPDGAIPAKSNLVFYVELENK